MELFHNICVFVSMDPGMQAYMDALEAAKIVKPDIETWEKEKE